MRRLMMTKVIVLIENDQEDYEILNDLFENYDVLPADCIYISEVLEIQSEQYDKYADQIYEKIRKTLAQKDISLKDVDLRIAIDLFLKPNDLGEPRFTIGDKSGFILLKLFTNKYLNYFGIVHSFMMSKITTGGEVYDYTEEELKKLKGGVALLNKPITVVKGHAKLIEAKYFSYLYTGILEPSKCTRRAYKAFVNAIIYGERR